VKSSQRWAETVAETTHLRHLMYSTPTGYIRAHCWKDFRSWWHSFEIE
jgi:hypothetical protein